MLPVLRRQCCSILQEVYKSEETNYLEWKEENLTGLLSGMK